jgi:hypothetical protein
MRIVAFIPIHRAGNVAIAILMLAITMASMSNVTVTLFPTR